MTGYPTYEDHQKSWEELAKGIASLKSVVKDFDTGNILPNSKKGELIIIGSGIETIGFSLGDKKLIEDADKVIFCVADPATIVWIKQLRPDALDLYVLYDENKVRYITYMQMTEAQLYYVRKGLKVVVIFYGHPGIFVLSTHRAIKLARREGYKATMKAGVCALDTLCADLGVDPCHPGMQTHEATDCLVRHRRIDPSLHVILWQVGLIGETGFRRQGYLNSNFSYFIQWLQGIYGIDYEITHYIGSRYPTIAPLIEVYKLNELHEPEKQTRITGLSTFYIPPRDVTPTNVQTALDLGLITDKNHVIIPQSPLREIGLYSDREMKAFQFFEKFRIPSSYRWQAESEASKFLIALRFDTDLQDLYQTDPEKALKDPRFSGLSDKERMLLASRDSGSIQIASKGIHIRSDNTEKTVTRLFSSKRDAIALMGLIAIKDKITARQNLKKWLSENCLQIDWAYLQSSIDFVNRNNLFPWTGVYIEPNKELAVTIIGNQTSRNRSVIYINNLRIRNFVFESGIIKWKASLDVPFNGFLRTDADLNGTRRILGKIWTDKEGIPAKNNFVAPEVDPQTSKFSDIVYQFKESSELNQIAGKYNLRTSGRFSKEVMELAIFPDTILICGKNVTNYSFEKGTLTWTGGEKSVFAGSIQFLKDPIGNTIEFFGESSSVDEAQKLKCYGSKQLYFAPNYTGPDIPGWAEKYFSDILFQNAGKGGLMLWQKWEKQYFNAKVVNKYLSFLI